MVIDTSALLAILLYEPEAERFAAAIEQDPMRLMSIVSALEASMIVESRHGLVGLRDLDSALQEMAVEITPLTLDHLGLCRHAARHYGKGRHAARLNLGDCCAYATAKLAGEPLLFKGDDFARTDVEPAL
jgi:ribonuclease VapC